MSPYRADTPSTADLRFQARIATVRSLIREERRLVCGVARGMSVEAELDYAETLA